MATLHTRPSEAEKEPILAFMSAAQMLNLKLNNGDLCNILGKGTDKSTTAVAWVTSRADVKDAVVGVSKVVQVRCGIKLGGDVQVSKSNQSIDDTSIVYVGVVDASITDEAREGWAWGGTRVIQDNYRFLIPGQRFSVQAGKQRNEFEVLAASEDTIYKISASSKVQIREPSTIGEKKPPRTTFDQIGGQHVLKTRLRHIIRQTTTPRNSANKGSTVNRARGVLLYGPMGVGKSLLREAVGSEFQWAAIHEWTPSTKITKTSEPQLVYVELLKKLDDTEAKALKQVFSSCSSTTLVVAEIRDPNDLQDYLRTSGTFRNEIEVPVPDTGQRRDILEVLSKGAYDADFLHEIATRTHGYVGDDLQRLLYELDDRTDEASNTMNGLSNDTDHTEQSRQTLSDRLADTLSTIRPSALQSIFLEKPSVKWSDIGGQESFKSRLRNAVEWPLKYPQVLREFRIPPKKGILLHGPPGCSKTMLVKALATGSDYNFLAVKGAELISMYVGESERATREVFRKARAAKPCIIFFDEIDAIARRASGSSELNVLTTLLNEMDGFEELKDVLVVAATNKPQSIDPALLRPGRFDNVLYVGPPDDVTREAILRHRFATTPRVDASMSGYLDEFVTASEGLSGAEIVAACQTASENAFIRGRAVPENMVRREDLLEAMRTMPRSITKKMLEEYESWNAERAAS